MSCCRVKSFSWGSKTALALKRNFFCAIRTNSQRQQEMFYLILHCRFSSYSINTLKARQNGRRFADIFTCVFLNENVVISLKFSPKFVPEVWINSIQALVQIMAWHRLGDKPLSEPMMVCLPTHICVTRPPCVKTVIPMMTSSNGNIFRVTGHLCGEFTGPRCFLWSASE